MPCICFGADSTRIRQTPRSLRICAPTPNVRNDLPARAHATVGGLTRRFRVLKNDCDTGTGLGNALHRCAQRPCVGLAAYTEQVALHVCDVHAHQGRLRAVETTVHQCGVRAPVHTIFVRVHAELAEVRLHGLLGDPLDRALVAEPVADEIGDRADLQVVLLREDFDLGATGWCRRRSSARRDTPAGFSPASLHRSTAASVWPARTSTPPRRARNGKMCPGRAKSSAARRRLASALMVTERSLADTPVLVPWR